MNILSRFIKRDGVIPKKKESEKSLDEIKKRLKLKSSKESLEAIILIYDATASMRPVWDETMMGVEKFISRIKVIAPKLKIGVVVFRDNLDFVKKLEPTIDKEKIKKFLRSIECMGGESLETGCEAVEAGISEFLNSSTMVGILVGDASPHSGYEEILKKLKGKGKQLYTVIVNSDCWFYDRTKSVYEEIAKMTQARSYLLEDIDDLIDVLSAMVAHKLNCLAKLLDVVENEQQGEKILERRKKILRLA